MAIYYIGAFPPAYGGVTIKNQNLYEALDQKLDLRKIDMSRIKRGDLREMLRLAWALATGKQFIIGLAGQRNRRVFTKLMYACKRKAMGRSVMLVMGGSVDDMIPEAKRFRGYRRVYVELPGMAQKLQAAGVDNAAVYPNGRPRPEGVLTAREARGPLKCVFFSIIRPEKGTDRILEVAGKLPEMQFHFYGPVDKEYEMSFLNAASHCENVICHGVFKGGADAVYRELAEYDVLLLPTRWKGEGLPGILIEAKIAGLAAIVTDHHYNREIVEHGMDGLVLAQDSVECLVEALKQLDGDRAKLLEMKKAGLASAQQYYIDVCAAAVLKDLERRNLV